MADLKLLVPRDGDIVNRHDGVSREGAFHLKVEGQAPAGQDVLVAADDATPVSARREGDRFYAELPLTARRHTVTARSGNAQSASRVLWDKDSFPRYRFSIDDNILFLKDLATGDYRSLFDHWFLGFWRDIHRRYGTKVHINIYYQTDESVFAGNQFQLPQLSDRYKGEWRDNSDWLHLTFHARQNKPDRPYKDAGYDEVARDFEAVTEQIRRFAGEQSLSPFTTVHWAEATREGVQALKDRGVRGLIGLFNQRSATANTKYFLSTELADHISRRDYWWDADMDMLYVSCDQVVNTYGLEAVTPKLDQVGSSPHTSEVVELLIHEQYFRKELDIYQPDVQQKVARAVEWVTDRGYKPVFYADGFVGA